MGLFVWARRALNRPKWRFSARAGADPPPPLAAPGCPREAVAALACLLAVVTLFWATTALNY
jgi:hypothetical protein